jgi:radical SAM-linked protein
MRAFERAARRASLPLAYSSGFNPRPKITFAAPLAVGMSGCREYVDFELEKELDPAEVLDRLRENMPGGLVPYRAQAVAKGPSLMSLVQRNRYLAVGEAPEGMDQETVAAGLERFLACGEITVERQSAKGLRRKNIRPGIHSLAARLEGGKLYLTMELKAGSAGNVRPDEVIAALGRELPLLPDVFVFLRTALLGGDGRLLWDMKGDVDG